MSKRYMYTYTQEELQRRRVIAVVVGFPVWLLLIAVGMSLFVRSIPVIVIVSVLLSVGITWLTWKFNKHQIKKFVETD